MLSAALGAAQPFRADTGPPLRLHLALRERAARPFPRPYLRAAGRGGARHWALQRADLDLAWWDGAGWGLARCAPRRGSLRGLLQLALAGLLPLSGGLSLHAASLVFRGQAYVFLGPSGVGKSTLVATSGGEPALGDEVALLRGQAGGWRAYASPFWSDDEGLPLQSRGADPAGYPVARLLFLRQRPTLERRRLDPDVAADALLGHTLAYGLDAALAQRLLDAAVGLCAAVPAEELGLPLGVSVWPGLAERAPEGRDA